MNMRIQRHQKNVHETRNNVQPGLRMSGDRESMLEQHVMTERRKHVRTACYDSGESMSEQHVMTAEKAC